MNSMLCAAWPTAQRKTKILPEARALPRIVDIRLGSLAQGLDHGRGDLALLFELGSLGASTNLLGKLPQ